MGKDGREVLVRGEAAMTTDDKLAEAVKKVRGTLDKLRAYGEANDALDELIEALATPERPAPAPAGAKSRVPDVFMYLVRQWMLDDKGRCRECEAHAEEEHREDCPLFIVYAALSSAATVTPPASGEHLQALLDAAPILVEMANKKVWSTHDIGRFRHKAVTWTEHWSPAVPQAAPERPLGRLYPTVQEQREMENFRMTGQADTTTGVPQAGAHTNQCQKQQG